MTNSGNDREKAFPDSCAVIALMARDCKSALKRNREETEKLARSFREAYIAVVENDSTDGTKEELAEWSRSNSCVCVISEDGVFSDSGRRGSGDGRIGRMAYFRNRYLEYAEKIRPDYLIVIDIDVDCFTAAGILSAMRGAPEDWAALFADGRFYTRVFGKTVLGKYYDTFAYVPAGSGYWEPTLPEIRTGNDALMKMLRAGGYIPCRSAFCGVGVYRWPCIEGLRYSVAKNTRSEEYTNLAEHVAFHRGMAGRGTLYIAGAMRVLYQYQTPFRLAAGRLVNYRWCYKAADLFGIRYRK